MWYKRIVEPDDTVDNKLRILGELGGLGLNYEVDQGEGVYLEVCDYIWFLMEGSPMDEFTDFDGIYFRTGNVYRLLNITIEYCLKTGRFCVYECGAKRIPYNMLFSFSRHDTRDGYSVKKGMCDDSDSSRDFLIESLKKV